MAISQMLTAGLSLTHFHHTAMSAMTFYSSSFPVAKLSSARLADGGVRIFETFAQSITFK